jgi:methylated-DNA-[protein]-cysteine S-methyltransferase
MTSIEYTFFATAIGSAAIAWGERGIVAVQIPGATESRTRDRILRMFPGASEGLPPPEVQRAIDAIAALLAGEPADLSGIVLDDARVPDFHRKVYAVARSIPPGRTLTYGEIAERLGDPGAARAVGQALGENPFPIVVPCHRVLAAGGNLGGFSAPGGTATKLKLLRIERAEAAAQLGLFD